MRPDLRHEHRRQRSAHGLDRQGTHHLLATSIPTARRFSTRPRISASPECPPKPDYSKGYVWAIYPGYDIFTANPDGSDLKQLTNTPGYDAEATISLDGKKIVFTSVRNGDLDIYTMDADGTNVKQLTHELGYDGGPTFSPDGKWIVYRAYHPKTEQEITDYKELLAQNLIRPTSLEIWIMKADGSDKRQITDLGAASFGPAFIADGKQIIFSSNYDPGSTGGMGNFELYGDRIRMARASSASLTATASRLPNVLARMARSWSGFPTATAKSRTRRISSSRIGCPKNL